MNKTKILAFIAIAAMLAACGSDDDGSPPELTGKVASISPFDTLVVKFNSDLVDINKFNDSNIVSTQKMTFITKNATGKELRFIGKNTTAGGWYYFDYGKMDSIVFKNLKNADGYVKDRTTFYFNTLPMLDIEPNASETRANDIGDIRKVEILFAGILDSITGVSEEGLELSDGTDYYTFKLKVADTVSVTVENREPLSVRIKGPDGVAVPETFQTLKGKPNSHEYIFGSDCLLDGKCSRDELVPFYIIVTRITSSPNPYTIRIKATEYKQKQ